MKWVATGLLVAAAMVGGRMAHSANLDEVENIAFVSAYKDYQADKPLTALASLMAADELTLLGEDSAQVEMFLAAELKRLGSVEEARRTYQAVANSAASEDVHDQAWLEVAKLAFEQGQLAEAKQVLGQIKGSLNGQAEQERQLIEVRALLADRQLQQAVKALPEIDGASAWATYQYFNIGVDLLERYHSKHGAVVLHHLCLLELDDAPEREAVRDQACLALGFSLMKLNKAARARAYFDKVRLDGHLSDIALLGMGWSYSQSGDFEKALVYWLELQQRASNSAYSFESLLAVPYAYSKASAFSQAIEQYKLAQQRIDEELKRLDDAKRSIERGNLSDLVSTMPSEEFAWFDKLKESTNATEGRVMPLLLANPGFQESLLAYRSLLQLDTYLRQMKTKVDALQALPAVYANGPEVTSVVGRYEKLRGQVQLALQASRGQLDAQALETLERYRVQLSGYVEQARFGMAQAIEGAVIGSGGVR